MIIISRDHKPFIFILIIALVLHTNCTAIDQNTITSSQNITDPQSLTSPEGVFKLGFFSPGSSTYRYVGIWYNKGSNPTVVWVANRENPIKDSSFGVLKIAEDGNLVVLDAQGLVHWTTDVSSIPFNSSIVELLDDGKLVLRQVSNRKILWESFEHPTDTFLPKMKFGGNRKTGKKLRLTSWKSESDPSPGTFFSELELNDIPQIVIWNGSKPHWRSGPWNSKRFIGIPNMDAAFLDGFYMSRDPQMEDDIYLTFKYSNNSSLVRIFLSSSGVLFGEIWDGRDGWKRYWPSNDYGECDVYGVCGPYGRCSMSEWPICSCLRGFMPKSPDEWYKGNWSSGCLRKTALKCEKNITTSSSDQDGFLKMRNMKVPDFANWVASPSNDKDCEQKCLKNCSCLAYWYDQDVGCMTWSGNLIDTKKFSTNGGVDLQIRVAHTELVKNSTKKKVIIAITVTLIGVLIFTCAYSYYKAVKAKQRDKDMELLLSAMHNTDSETCNRTNGSDLEIFKFEKIMMATNNFCEDNKLGEGGFGSVYKGKFTNGQELAVKRLSMGSRQGIVEFKNEVQVIVKLQHRNLVRLLGCCIEEEEKMLIYEYLPNKSLDAFLFDPKKRALLDWESRFKIMEGICRGILYLHRDSRLRVIHRDLKASNILLDEEFNPKISDFGMARIFKSDDELQANTKRIVGTYGYMSPEYAMKGQFSEKSDVFSFGVLLLEIISGKRNSSFYHQEQPASLSEYAWQLWKEKRSQSLIDTTLSLSEEIYEVEILRCIHVGLLCVQEYVNDRPNMSTILSMLTSEIATLPTPKKPPFTERLADSNSNPSSANRRAFTINDVTITELEGR